MSNLENVRCNLCKEDNTESLSTVGQFGFKMNTVICKNCSLMYINPRWNSRRYSEFYAHDYDRYYRPNLKTSLTHDPSSMTLVRRLKHHLATLSPNAHILEIGSGEGSNLLAIQSILPIAEYDAIEPSIKSQEILKDHGIQPIASDVMANWQSTKKYDLIVMRHVLEHMMDPSAVLQKIRSQLKPDGLAYIAVPNALNPRGQIESFWLRIVHTYYFNRHTLKGILEKNGLAIVQIEDQDSANPNEIYAIVKPGEHQVYLAKPELYQKQKDKLQSLIRRDRNPVVRILNKILRKLKKSI